MIKGKVIIVVGATGGIGEPVVREFVDHGALVTLFARRKEKLEALASTLPADSILTIPGDATLPEDVVRAFELTSSHFGKVDAVVISAGTWKRLGIDESIDEALGQLSDLYKSIFLPSFVSAYVAQKFFRGQKSGMIFNVSSHAAIRPDLSGNMAYGPMKAAAHDAMLRLGNELQGTGIKVIDLMPAIVNTPDASGLLDTQEKRNSAVQPKEIADFIIEQFDNPNPPESKLFESKITL